MRYVTCVLVVVLTAMAVSAMAGVVYVKQDAVGPVFDGASWETAFETVQAGVNAAAAGDEVRVAAGDYPESVALKSGVKLLGGYQGMGDTRDINAYVTRIVNCAGVGPGTVDGFTIEGGTGKAVSFESGSGTVKHNTIKGSYQYGIYCAVDGPVVLENTVVMSSVDAWGTCYGVCAGGGQVNCNRVSGADIGVCGYGTTISNNIIYDNHIGVQVAGDTTSGRVYNNLVYKNSGAGIYNASRATMTPIGNIVCGNGCGIDNQYGGSAICNDVYGNQVDYSGAIPRTSDISADPGFENPEAGDFRLSDKSPCIDKCASYLVPNATTDIAGNPRKSGATWDIGPYEFLPEQRLSMSPSRGLLHIVDPGETVSGVGELYTFANISSDTSMSWAASKTADWLDMSDSHGTLAPGQAVSIYARFNSSANTLSPGHYSDLITITNTTTGEVSTRSVRLIVGKVIHVKADAPGPLHDGTTWDKAYATISEAIEAAQPGQEIWVAKGVYREALDITKNVILKGSYRGQGDVRDNHYYQSTIERSGEYGDTIVVTSPCTIDGFTITKGFDGVYGIGLGQAIVSNCTLKGNINAGATFKSAPGTVTSSTITQNRYGLSLGTSAALAVNNLVVDNSAYNISLTSGARAVNNTLVGSGDGSGLTNSGTSVMNNLSVDRLRTNLNNLFVYAAGGNYHLLPGVSCIDAGVSDGAPVVDMEGNLRTRDGDGDGVAKVDLGCYEFGVSNMVRISEAKSLPDGASVGLASPVVTASFTDRCYVENPDRSSGIGVIGRWAPAGTRVAVAGIVETVDGEKIIRANRMTHGVNTIVPAPWYVNFNSLGGGPLGLQAGVYDWRMVKKVGIDGEPYWVRNLFTYGGANNIGLLVKMAGKVSHSGSGYFYLDGSAVYDDGDASVRGVRVDWPYSTLAPADGSFVTVLGISSCRVVHDDLAGDVVVRMLRPVSAEAVKTVAGQ